MGLRLLDGAARLRVRVVVAQDERRKPRGPLEGDGGSLSLERHAAQGLSILHARVDLDVRAVDNADAHPRAVAADCAAQIVARRVLVAEELEVGIEHDPTLCEAARLGLALLLEPARAHHRGRRGRRHPNAQLSQARGGVLPRQPPWKTPTGI